MYAVDGTVVTHRPATVRKKEPTPALAGKAVLDAHKGKVAKYKAETKSLSKHLGEPVKFVAWVFSELGVAHSSTVSFLKTISKQLPQHDQKRMLTRVFTRLAYALADVNYANAHSWKARAFGAQ